MNRSRFLSLAASLLVATAAHAQTFGLGEAEAPKQERVVAELLAAVTAAAPGQPFQAAVKLVHAKETHSYGKVLPPGIVGKPTKLTWTLPEGWQMEELPWPPTHQVPSTDGAISDGYDGTVYLPVKITPPASAAADPTTAAPAEGRWASFAAAVAGEWEGISASFDYDGDAKQLPEY